MVQAGGEGLLVGGDLLLVPAPQGAGCGGLGAERGCLAGAHELGGGQPGPCFLDDQPRGAGAQDRAAGAVPAPVIVVLPSPNVVSDALHLVR